MLLRRLQFRPTKSATLITCLLASTLYYFLVLHTHGYGHAGCALQPALVSRHLWPTHRNTTPTTESLRRTCSEHGFAPYWPKNGTRRRVYDLVPLLHELDWLEIRLRTLAPFVDYFVIVEYTTTFTGIPNLPILQHNWSRFEEFKDQILHFIVQDEVNSSWVWDHERWMKNAMLYKTFPMLADSDRQASEGDVLVVSDVDEIPKPETITLLRYCDFPERLTLRSHFYYYSFQWLHQGEQWAHPQATVYHGVNGTISPQDLRRGGGVGSFLAHPLQRWMQRGNLWDAAWHCSSCFKTIKEVQAKMASFSHENWNTPENRDPKTITERVRNGIDLFGRQGQSYNKVDNNTDVPRYILESADRFKYLIDRDGEEAAFADYWPQI